MYKHDIPSSKFLEKETEKDFKKLKVIILLLIFINRKKIASVCYMVIETKRAII